MASGRCCSEGDVRGEPMEDAGRQHAKAFTLPRHPFKGAMDKTPQRRSSFKKFGRRLLNRMFNAPVFTHPENVPENPPTSVPLRSELMGLRNHGNTCFINAVLQCLTHTELLAMYFVYDQYRLDLRKRNRWNSKKYGTQGEVTEGLAGLIKSLWTSQYTPDVSTKFKSIIEKYGSQYKGNNQHDAQEFLLWLLDKVHEDLNTARKKKYKKVKSSVGRPDDTVAAETLANHLRCNSSYVHTLFQAQFQSSLTCPRCNRKSSTFDPFLCLSIPIPQKQVKNVFPTIVYLNAQPREVKVGMSIDPNACMGELRELIASDTGIPSHLLLLTEIDGEGFHRTFTDNQPVTVLGQDSFHSLYAMEMPEAKHNTESDGAFILLVWINLLALENSYRRFGSPSAVLVSRETSYEDLQKLLLKEMHHMLKENVLTEYQEPPLYGIMVHDGVDGGPTGPPLDPSLEVPLYAECVETALSLCDDHAGPPHVKLTLLWEQTEKDSIIIDDTECIEEHASVKQLKENNNVAPPVTLQDCLQLYTDEEKLGPDDAWLCPVCNRKQEGVKRLALWSVPDFLILHLKRFRQPASERLSTKLNTMVEFPLTDLDMSMHLVAKKSPSPPETNGVGIFGTLNPWKRPASTPATPVYRDDNVYHLYGIINHHGEDVQGGHYTAFCRSSRDDQWYSFDDTTVEKKEESAVITEDAYILFYQRTSVQSRSESPWINGGLPTDARNGGFKRGMRAYHSMLPMTSHHQTDGHSGKHVGGSLKRPDSLGNIKGRSQTIDFATSKQTAASSKDSQQKVKEDRIRHSSSIGNIRDHPTNLLGRIKKESRYSSSSNIRETHRSGSLGRLRDDTTRSSTGNLRVTSKSTDKERSKTLPHRHLPSPERCRDSPAGRRRRNSATSPTSPQPQKLLLSPRHPAETLAVTESTV